MYDRPFRGRADLPPVISHASRGGSAPTGFRSLRATPDGPNSTGRPSCSRPTGWRTPTARAGGDRLVMIPGLLGAGRAARTGPRPARRTRHR